MTNKTKKDKLTPLQKKRVDILKDALIQIELEAYRPEAGIGYVNGDARSSMYRELFHLALEQPQAQLQTHLDGLVNPSKPCQVCAKGAILLSAVRKYNHLTLSSAKYNMTWAAQEKSRGIFGVENADLMEKFFETENPIYPEDNFPLNNQDKQRNAWLKKYPSSRDRLVAIFKNAIRNKGIFTPNLKIAKT